MYDKIHYKLKKKKMQKKKKEKKLGEEKVLGGIINFLTQFSESWACNQNGQS